MNAGPIILGNQIEDVLNVRAVGQSPLHSPPFAVVYASAGSVATHPESCPSHDGIHD